MKLLYLSLHEVLEWDDLRLFQQIPGLKVFSLGSFMRPRVNGRLRPGLDMDHDEELAQRYLAITPPDGLSADRRNHLTRELVEPFDAVMVNHYWPWLFNNRGVLAGKTVIWRDIGQTWPHDEIIIRNAIRDGVKIVRNWSGYSKRKDYAGHDAVIPFGKFASDYTLPWTGEGASIMGLVQWHKQRGDETNHKLWEESTNGLPRKLYGVDNDGDPDWAGQPDWEGLKLAMSKHRVFWYGGSRPAPYTLALMEAMFAGMPIVAPYRVSWEDWATPGYIPTHRPENMHRELNDLIGLPPMKGIGERNRAKAAELWGHDKITPLWEEFFKTL